MGWDICGLEEEAMMVEKLSINKACVLAGIFLISISVMMFAALYWLSERKVVFLCVFLFVVLVFICIALILLLVRRKLTLFSNALCMVLDNMLAGVIEKPQIAQEENLFYKINHRLVRLYEVMQENRNSVARERTDLQELVSDIAHQVKTPIANLKMVNATLLQQSVPEKQQKEFLLSMQNQLDKLEFLMQAMIKTSRLETGVISLEKKQQPIYETLAQALGGILLHAEKKQIIVHVDCPETLAVSHDRKWTSEALFNILDNAVKYTPVGGKINVVVFCWEMYVKLDIIDTGRGIAEQQQGAIFKRFYRAEDVHDIDGIGIGLYLAREIVTKQGGHIRVSSDVGQGATFSVFLPRT